MSLPRHVAPVEPDPELLALFEQAAHVPASVRRQAEFFVFFARKVFPLLESYRARLELLYCPDNGRPAWDPVRFFGVLILQFVMRASDRQAAEAVQYDKRWRLALHLRAGDATFDPSLLVTFRDRLLSGGEESLAFEAVLDYLVAQGWVPKRSRQRLDSTHVWGLLREMSRLDCVRETLRLLLEDVEADELLPPGWSAYWERYVESKIDPRSGKTARQAKAAEAGRGMLAIWEEAAGSWPIAARDSFVLLQRVFLENYELDPAECVRETRTTPTSAVHNPHEPEAQSRPGQGAAPKLPHRRRLQHPAALPSNHVGDGPHLRTCRNGRHGRRPGMTNQAKGLLRDEERDAKMKCRSALARCAPTCTQCLPGRSAAAA